MARKSAADAVIEVEVDQEVTTPMDVESEFNEPTHDSPVIAEESPQPLHSGHQTKRSSILTTSMSGRLFS